MQGTERSQPGRDRGTGPGLDRRGERLAGGCPDQNRLGV